MNTISNIKEGIVSFIRHCLSNYELLEDISKRTNIPIQAIEYRLQNILNQEEAWLVQKIENCVQATEMTPAEFNKCVYDMIIEYLYQNLAY